MEEEFIALRGRAKDIAGQRFGRLVALGPIGQRPSKHILWLCQCDCGNTTVASSDNLRRAVTQSCGCLQKERSSKASITHGMARHPLHNVWRGIISRCTNPNYERYPRWGGRGITICDEWRHDFQAFHDYVTRLPAYGEEGYTIDRIDNMEGYQPGNIKWSTPTDQARNRRANRLISFDGRTQCLQAWADEYSINVTTLRARLERDWPLKTALTTPLRNRKPTDDR